MEQVAFKPWPKIPRESPAMVTITEKIDGSNGCIIIDQGELVGVQSRRRLIAVGDDNFGFAAWVATNEEELKKLGDGYHYGEWAGPGIQKNPHDLAEKTFYLFNTFRWNAENPNKPACCQVVPVLFEGLLGKHTVADELVKLREAAPLNQVPEGLIVYHHAFRKYTKHTLRAPQGKWQKD